MPSDALIASSKRLAVALARKRRAALGPVLSLDDAAMGALSTVTVADLPTVEAFVRDAAGEFGVSLLRAKREG